jgi:hypothetical protein
LWGKVERAAPRAYRPHTNKCRNASSHAALPFMAHPAEALERVDKQIVAGEQAVRELRNLINRSHGQDQAVAKQLLKLAEDALDLTIMHRSRIS